MQTASDQIQSVEAAYLQISVHDSPGVNVLYSFKYPFQQVE